MSYEVRVLPPEEWTKLAGTEAETVWPHLNPVNTRVMVVEDEGRVVGTWIGMRTVHAECLWIHPDYRHKPGVGRRLILGMSRIAKYWDVDLVLTSSLTEAVERIIRKMRGQEMPGKVFALPFRVKG